MPDAWPTPFRLPPESSGAVQSGHLAAGAVGSGHLDAGLLAGLGGGLSSGSVQSGHIGMAGTPTGSLFFRDDFSWAAAEGGLVSGSVQSGHVVSGSVGGFYGPTRHVQSGTVGSTDLGSGAVETGALGSGAVQSGNVASGSIGRFHIASGRLAGFELGSGAIVSGRIASGQIGTGHLADDSVTSGDIASGSLSTFKVASGGLLSGAFGSGQIGQNHLGSGAVLSGHVASGQVGNFHLSSGCVTSGRLGVTGTPDGSKVLRDDFTWAAPGAPTINSGDILRHHLGSGVSPGHVAIVRSGLSAVPLLTEEAISGVRAVQVSQSGRLRIAMASLSGRMPAVGVVFDNVASGLETTVYAVGPFQLSSGMADYSGWLGRTVFVGRSGQLVQWSGSFNSGGFSVASGADYVQRLGTILNSGAVLLNVALHTEQWAVDSSLEPQLTDSLHRRFGF